VSFTEYIEITNEATMPTEVCEQVTEACPDDL